MRKSITSYFNDILFEYNDLCSNSRDRATELKEQAQSSLNQKITSKHVTYSKGIRSICNPRKLSTGNRMWCSG